MRFIYTLLFLTSALLSYSQSISNVSSIQQGNNAFVTYDLNGSPGLSYYVKLYYSTDGGQSFSNELLQVTGDAKSGVKTGIGKKITWAADREVNYLNGNVIFKVEAESRKLGSKPVTIENTTVEVVKVTRNGEDVVVEFILTQNTEKEIQEFELLRTSQLTTQDGKQYDPLNGKFGTQIMVNSSTNRVQCPKGIPTRGIITFKIESSDLVIAAVKLNFYVNHNGSHSIFVIRNIPVQ